MAESKPGGRGYGAFHENATPESKELAQYLRALVKQAGKTQRDLQEPTNYSKSTISSFLSGETVPPRVFVQKLVKYVTNPRQELTCMNKAMQLYVRTQTARPAPAPHLPAPRPAAEDSSPASLASVAATAQDQAAKAHEQLAQAHERNQELMEERGRTQQLVLSLSRFTAELQQQVTTLEDQYDEENEENEERLRKLTEQLEAAQRAAPGPDEPRRDREPPGPAAQTQRRARGGTRPVPPDGRLRRGAAAPATASRVAGGLLPRRLRERPARRGRFPQRRSAAAGRGQRRVEPDRAAPLGGADA